MLNEKAIAILEGQGFKRWKKNGHDRLYFNFKDYGIASEEKNERGDVTTVLKDGTTIKWLCRGSKAYIDVKGERVVSTYVSDELHELLENMLQKAIKDTEQDPEVIATDDKNNVYTIRETEKGFIPGKVGGKRIAPASDDFAAAVVDLFDYFEDEEIKYTLNPETADRVKEALAEYGVEVEE